MHQWPVAFKNSHYGQVMFTNVMCRIADEQDYFIYALNTFKFH